MINKVLLLAFLGASFMWAADEPKKTPPKIDAELRVTYWRLDAQSTALQSQLSDVNKEKQANIDKLVKSCGDDFLVTLDNVTKDLICTAKPPIPSEKPKSDVK